MPAYHSSAAAPSPVPSWPSPRFRQAECPHRVPAHLQGLGHWHSGLRGGCESGSWVLFTFEQLGGTAALFSLLVLLRWAC